jgi:hypothetical protein
VGDAEGEPVGASVVGTTPASEGAAERDGTKEGEEVGVTLGASDVAVVGIRVDSTAVGIPEGASVGEPLGSAVTGASVTGAAVTGAAVTGAAVTGAAEVGAAVTGMRVVGAAVTGAGDGGSLATGAGDGGSLATGAGDGGSLASGAGDGGSLATGAGDGGSDAMIGIVVGEVDCPVTPVIRRTDMRSTHNHFEGLLDGLFIEAFILK